MSTTSTSIKTGHVGINVTDLERSIAFYTQVFGFEVAVKSEDADKRFAFLKNGDTLILTLWQQAEASFDGKRSGLHHLSFQVPDLVAVQDLEKRLQEQGAAMLHEGVVAHSEGASSGGVFFTDPDGTRLEVYAPSGLESHCAPSGSAPSCGFF